MSKNIFDKHKTKIAKQTLRMSDVGAVIMGGMTKDEARVPALKADWEKCRTATNNAHAELRKADANGDTTFLAAEYFRCLALEKASFRALRYAIIKAIPNRSESHG